MTADEDFRTVREALKRLRAIAFNRRYGGYLEEYELAKAALEALERIERPRLS